MININTTRGAAGPPPLLEGAIQITVLRKAPGSSHGLINATKVTVPEALLGTPKGRGYFVFLFPPPNFPKLKKLDIVPKSWFRNRIRKNKKGVVTYKRRCVISKNQGNVESRDDRNPSGEWSILSSGNKNSILPWIPNWDYIGSWLGVRLRTEGDSKSSSLLHRWRWS